MSNRRIKGGARLRDVAAAAGVSKATASAVVNGHADQYGICQATQAKVQAAVRQLGYAPSLAALDMSAGRNSLVGLAISADIPGADRLIAALEPALSLAGLRLLVISLPADPATASARIADLARFGVGGLAIYPASSIPLTKRGCPVVMVGKADIGLPVDCSQSAVIQLGQAAARWLLLASQGTPPRELLLEPSPVVGATIPLPTVSAPVSPIPPPAARPAVCPVEAPNPPPARPVTAPVTPIVLPPVRVTAPPPVPLPVPLTPPPITVANPVTPAEDPSSVTPPLVETPLVSAVSEPPSSLVMIPENQSDENDAELPMESSEPVQITETVGSDGVGQGVSDSQTTPSVEPEVSEELDPEPVTVPPESIPIPTPTPDPVVVSETPSMPERQADPPGQDPEPTAVTLPTEPATPISAPVVVPEATPVIEPVPVAREPETPPPVSPVVVEPVAAPVPEPIPVPVAEQTPAPQPPPPPAPVPVSPSVMEGPVIVEDAETVAPVEPEMSGETAPVEEPEPLAP